ncbi:hypothetical protein JW998_05325, partial [candidate division KSB1 bacterium]|nr:hypothetical protein [candidate division KSB1 bacterium]
HQDERVNVFDDIPAVGPLQVTVAVAQPPQRVRLQPGDRPVEYEYEKGKISLQIDRLELHDIILCER